MPRQLDIWLNDVSLRDVDARIIIRDMHEKAAQIKTTFGDIPVMDGQRLLDMRRASKTITVEIAIRELYDLGTRQLILDAVNRWAADGWMKSTAHPGQRIYVHATGWPTLENVRKYGDTYMVTFVTAGSPYWEDEAPMTWSSSGTSMTGTVTNLGSVSALPDVTVTPASATLNDLTITVGGTSFIFDGLSISAGAALKVTHDERGILLVTSGTTSKLAARTAASDDELVAQPGVNSVSVAADVEAAVTIAVRGRYR